MSDNLFTSKAREAELREKLEAAEARIKASQEQEPVAYANARSFNDHSFAVVRGKALQDDVPLFAQPIIPHELAELQRENSDLRTALKVSREEIAQDIVTLANEAIEIRKLLEESKVPEGWSISKLKTCYTLSHGNEVIATLAGPDAEKHATTIAAMLSAQPKEPKQ